MGGLVLLKCHRMEPGSPNSYHVSVFIKFKNVSTSSHVITNIVMTLYLKSGTLSRSDLMCVGHCTLIEWYRLC